MSLQVQKQKAINSSYYIPISSYTTPNPIAQICNLIPCCPNNTVQYTTNSFSIVGSHRNGRSGVGTEYKMSKSGSPFKGLYAYNLYQYNKSGLQLMNAGPGLQVAASQANYVKKSNVSSATRMKQQTINCNVVKKNGPLTARIYTENIGNNADIKPNTNLTQPCSNHQLCSS